MDIKLENELYNIDPIFFKDAIKCQNGEMNEMQTCMYFGCECGDGWFEPLKKMTQKLAEINKIAKNYNFEFYCEQLKEKYGTLHCYWNSRAIDLSIKTDYHAQWDILSDIVSDIINKAEKDCNHVCEFCGADGGYRNENIFQTHGYISFICRKCAKEMHEREAKHYAEISGKEYKKVICDFEEEYDFLSPYHHSHFTMEINGKKYNFNSIIHAWCVFKDPEHINLYSELSKFDEYSQHTLESVAQEFFDGNLFSGTLKEYEVLDKIIESKFTDEYNKKLLDQFLETYGYQLQYRVIDHNNTWGICCCDKCKSTTGSNAYGMALERVRKKIYNENKK